MSHIIIIWQLFTSLFTGTQIPLDNVIVEPQTPVEIADVSSNEMGRIPILEYHSIGQTETRWTRSTVNFRGDLEWLHNNDYVLLSIEDYAHNLYPIPVGKKPVVMTFDDGKSNQFRYLENGEIDPGCAVGILDQFYQEYPEFGSAAVFYLNRNPFGPAAEAEKKIEYLHRTGRQIGYHTPDHNDLRRFGAEGTRILLERQKEELKLLMPEGMDFTTLAYPHGWGPAGGRSGMAPLVTVGLLIGAKPAYPLYHENADPYRTPRIQAIEEEWLRHFGRYPGETVYQEDPEKFEVFVSDGIAESSQK